MCVHEKIRKIQKKSPNAHPLLVMYQEPVERSTGTNFINQNPIFCYLLWVLSSVIELNKKNCYCQREISRFLFQRWNKNLDISRLQYSTITKNSSITKLWTQIAKNRILALKICSSGTFHWNKARVRVRTFF